MKLIIAGASGFVGSEVVRQALHRPEITSVIALSRTATTLKPGTAGSEKLKNVIIEDYDKYPGDVSKELAGAAGCIWTTAITPFRAKDFDFSEVKRVCQTSTLDGLKAIHGAGPAKPFRFIYMSGVAAQRDQTKTPIAFGEYSWMRGETENQVLAYAAAHPDVEAGVAKAGLIWAPWKPIENEEVAKVIGLIELSEISAAMIHQIIYGIEKDPLMNDDMVRIGREVLGKD